MTSARPSFHLRLSTAAVNPYSISGNTTGTTPVKQHQPHQHTIITTEPPARTEHRQRDRGLIFRLPLQQALTVSSEAPSPEEADAEKADEVHPQRDQARRRRAVARVGDFVEVPGVGHGPRRQDRDERNTRQQQDLVPGTRARFGWTAEQGTQGGRSSREMRPSEEGPDMFVRDPRQELRTCANDASRSSLAEDDSARHGWAVGECLGEKVPPLSQVSRSSLIVVVAVPPQSAAYTPRCAPLHAIDFNCPVRAKDCNTKTDANENNNRTPHSVRHMLSSCLMRILHIRYTRMKKATVCTPSVDHVKNLCKKREARTAISLPKSGVICDMAELIAAAEYVHRYFLGGPQGWPGETHNDALASVLDKKTRNPEETSPCVCLDAPRDHRRRGRLQFFAR